MNTADDSSDRLTDVGPATPPPSWCLPDVEPSWEVLTERFGGGPVCFWTRDVADSVWIACEDRLIDGRVMRTAPRIQYYRDLIEGFDGAQLLVHGKGDKKRIVPLSDSLAGAIRAGAAGHTPGASSTGWLFPNWADGHLTPYYIAELAQRVLSDPWTLHTLRQIRHPRLPRHPQPSGCSAVARTCLDRHDRTLLRGRRLRDPRSHALSDGGDLVAGNGNNDLATIVGNGDFGTAANGNNDVVAIVGSGSTAQAGLLDEFGPTGSNDLAAVFGNDLTANAFGNEMITILGNGMTAMEPSSLTSLLDPALLTSAADPSLLADLMTLW